MVKGLVDGPFLVINADDYYGREAFKKIHDYMVNTMDADSDVYDLCMGGFVLSNTLSDNGAVTRGVCQVDDDGILKTVNETYNIRMTENGLLATDEQGNPVTVSPDQPVSMNMWGLPVKFLEELEQGFPEFLDHLKEGDVMTARRSIPSIVENFIKWLIQRFRSLRFSNTSVSFSFHSAIAFWNSSISALYFRL